jgi:hypothetical protein
MLLHEPIKSVKRKKKAFEQGDKSETSQSKIIIHFRPERSLAGSLAHRSAQKKHGHAIKITGSRPELRRASENFPSTNSGRIRTQIATG